MARYVLARAMVVGESLLAGVMIVLLSVSGVQADTLNISFGQANYDNMVKDAKLRGDGNLENWNLGAGSGGSNRFYANTRLDGTPEPAPNTRKNTFLQWFDVSSIPAGSVINSATLTTYMANQTANTRTWVDVNLSRLQSGNNWVEVVLGGNGPHTDGSVTWNDRISHPTTPTPWATPGALNAADIDLGTTQTFDVVGIDGQATTVVRDITAWVQSWVDAPASNAGMLWWGGKNDDSGAGNRYFWFGVKEDGAGPAADGVAAAPSLVIDYTPGGVPVAPIIEEVAPDPDSVFAGQEYVEQLTLTQGTFPITWSVLPGAPSGAVVSGSGLVSGWTPGVGDIGMTFTFQIRAENAVGNDIESWQVQVLGVPPVIAEVATDPDFATPGTGYTQQLSLVQGTPPVTWSVVAGSPPGTQVDSNGLVSGWTPGAGDLGMTFNVEIRAESPYGNDTESWQVQVIRVNNGFATDAVFVVRHPDNGGQTRLYDKYSEPPGTRFAAFNPGGDIQPDETDWESITFSGKGHNDDARLFLAKPNLALNDVEIVELNYLGQTINSTNLSSIIGASPGPAVSFGNIRYSRVSNTLFLALNPNTSTTSTAVCYEFPLSLAANSQIHTYLGETLPPASPPDVPGFDVRAAVAINARDGTLYMVGQHLGDATASGLGDLISFSTTAGPFDGQGVNTTFSVLIDGQTCNTGNANYVQPSTPIYRRKGVGGDTLLIPTNTDQNTAVLEFYLDTTLHPVDGNGNLALRTDNPGPLTIGRGWNGQQDIATGDIWLGAKHHGFHVIRADDATATYETSPSSRDWMDAAVPPFEPCNEPFADIDGDGDVDSIDFATFQNCLTEFGPVAAECSCFDRDKDNNLDSFDYSSFEDCGTGPAVPWSQELTPLCSP